MSENITLRQKKSAKIKLGILHTTLQLVGRQSFTDLYVDEICERVKISKVTFFKYFPQKEDVLMYYLRVWNFHRAVELSKGNVAGLTGVFYLFDKMGEDCEQYPGFILSLMGYLTETKRSPKPFPVKPAERKLLYPEMIGIQKIEIQSINQMFERFVLEAIFRKEITKTGDVKSLTDLLVTIFYGSVVTFHIQKTGPLKLLFRRNAEAVVNSLR